MYMIVSIVLCFLGSVQYLHAQGNVFPDEIPMGCVKIKAKVIKIETAKAGKKNKDFYSKTPCRAQIQLIEILGYGRDAENMAINPVFSAFFVYTLLPTDPIQFPEVNLKGLKEGEIFIGFINHNKQGKSDYTILQYQKE